MLGFQAASKNLELVVNVHPNVPESVIGDPQRIRQCLMNLISNAIKFTRQGEVVVDVSHDIELHDKPRLRFQVRDTGIGLAPDDAAKLFQPFTQADSSTTRKYGGTGLGLSIVKRLVEMMGGEVGIDSKLGTGSTFWFFLPLQAAEPVLSLPATGTKPLTGKRLLIVDDNATSRQVLSLQLQHVGYETTVTDSGDAALQALQQPATDSTFDAVLIDFQMPDIDGALLAERIAATPELASLPRVLLTFMDRQGDPQGLASMGFAAYLTKPIRTRELRDCLQRVLSVDSQRLHSQTQRLTRPKIREGIAAERYLGNVLLVDDNLVNQQVGSRFLERMGLTVTLASDGAEAVKAYETHSFDMIFMDLQMPIMDGFEATRRIRDFEAWNPRKPIIALTANALSGQLERCIASGMDGFLTKPIQIDQLRDVVKKHCRKVTTVDATLELDGQETAALLQTPATGVHAQLNVERLRQSTNGDLSFMRELAQLYVEGSQQILAELGKACASNDRVTLCRAAHKLKGASASIHAEQVAHACAILEQRGAELDTTTLTEQLEQLVGLVASAKNELDVLLKHDQSAA
jgi:CheY-like chemotaxis protein/HPt (histidine-containing phosphotransfer) domain-containing protein